MSLIVNGVTLPSNAVITCNGVALSSIVCNAVEVWKKGTLTLKEVVFNASGTFTMPANVVNNQIIVCVTGGGGSGYADVDSGYYGGSGSGRVVSTLTMSAGQTASVIVGAGGVNGGAGGTSSFTGATSCGGGSNSFIGSGIGVSGGGNGGTHGSGRASSCASALTLQAGAVDGTTGLYTAKSFAGGATSGGSAGGGGGCYGAGATVSNAGSNTGAGGGAYIYLNYTSGGSGKVVVYYYVME